MSALRRARTPSVCTYEAGSFEWAETVLAGTGRLTPEQVALVLERNPDTPLTRTLRAYLIRLKRREVRREQGSALIDRHDEQTLASERAYKAVLQEMQACSIDWTTLRNLLSLRRREPELFFDLEARRSELIPSQTCGEETLTLPGFINDNAATMPEMALRT